MAKGRQGMMMATPVPLHNPIDAGELVDHDARKLLNHDAGERDRGELLEHDAGEPANPDAGGLLDCHAMESSSAYAESSSTHNAQLVDH